MPIKPENLKRYPSDWKTIREEVLARASHKCEQCGVPNHWLRNNTTGEITKDGMVGETWELADGDKVTYIVLTIAHKNHIPEDCGEPGNRPNLAAWCQKCHLAYDHEHHQRNAHETRRSGKAVGDLFHQRSSLNPAEPWPFPKPP